MQLPRNFALTLAILVTLAGCSSSKSGGSSPPHRDGPGSDPAPGATPPADPNAPETGAPAGVSGVAELVTVKAAIKLRVLPAAQVATATEIYSDLKDVFAEHCVRCHAAGATLPSLANFPFVGANGEPLAATLDKIKDRINHVDPTRSTMPPTGALDAALVARLSRWIDAGAPTTVAGAVDARDYRVAMRLAPAGAWMTVDPVAAVAGVALGRLAPGSPLTIDVKIVGPLGHVALRRSLGVISVPADGLLTWSLVAPVEDLAQPLDVATPVTPVNPPQDPPVPPAVPVEVRLTWTLHVTAPAANPDLVTFADVGDIFQSKCLFCHSTGQNAPNLALFPFVGANGEPLAATLGKIKARTVDGAAPMPQSGLLSAALAGRLARWIDFGGLPAPADGVEPQGYALAFRLLPDGLWTSLAAGASVTAIGARTPGSALIFEVMVNGPAGHEVLRKTLEPLVVPADGALKLSVYATQEDVAAPRPGAEGALAFTEFDGSAFIVRWQPAVDAVTPVGQLEYRLYQSPSADIDGVAAVGEHGQPLSDWSAALLFTRVSGADLATPPFFNVLVRDKSGNVAAYAMARAEVKDTTAPVPGAGGALTVSALTDRSVVLGWAPGSDDIATSDELKYQVVAINEAPIDTLARADLAVPVGEFKAAVVSRAVKGLIPKTRYTFNVLVMDKSGNRALYQQVEVKTVAASGNEDYDILAYGKDCAERLGTLKPFNCLDGQIIPITVDGKVPAEGYPSFAPHASDSLACDRPALLGLGGNSGQCPPYARLGHLKSYRPDGAVVPDVETVFICRRYKGRFGEGFDWTDGAKYEASVFPGFEDIAVIQHNAKTGETCWFQMLALKDGRRVPPPTEAVLPAGAPSYAESAQSFWLHPSNTASIKCLTCHDSDSWVHSPYVDQVKGDDGKPLVPSHVFGPYKMIGRAYFTDWLAGEASFAVQPIKADGTPEDNKCTSCHRIGSLGTCGNFAGQSVGASAATDVSAFGVSQFALSHWMPPTGSEGVTTQAQWDADVGHFKRDSERVLDCCNNPDSPSCTRSTPINTPPPPFAAP